MSLYYIRGGVAQCVARLNRNEEVVGSSPIKATVVSLSKKRYPYCLVLVGFRNGFERNFTTELKQIEGLMEDWLKCHISPLDKYMFKTNTVYSHS